MSEDIKRYASEEYVDEKLMASQADWAQLDPSAFDYVRSKPFGYTTEGFVLDDGSSIRRINIESGTSGEYRCIYNAGSRAFVGYPYTYSHMASDTNIEYYLMFSMYGVEQVKKDVICIGGENWGYGSAITNTDEASKPYTWAVFIVDDISTLNEEYKEHFTNRGIYFINYSEDTQVEWVSLVFKTFISDTFIFSTIARTADVASTYATKSELESYETVENAQAKLDESKSYTDTSVAAVVNSAPETLNTLNELATALGNDENFATTVATQIGEKANTTDLTAHTTNTSNPHEVTKDQVGLGSVANVLQYSADNPPPYPVTSVNGKTGAVTLNSETFTFVLEDGTTVTKSLVVM